MQDILGVSEELENVLTKIKNILENVLEIEDAKYEALKDISIDILMSLNDDEEAYLKIFEKLEIQRQHIVDSLSLMIGFDPQAPISFFVEKLPTQYNELITKICYEIKKISYRITIATDRNNYILETNAGLITQILDYTCGHLNDQYNHQGLAHNELTKNLHVLDQLV